MELNELSTENRPAGHIYLMFSLLFSSCVWRTKSDRSLIDNTRRSEGRDEEIQMLMDILTANFSSAVKVIKFIIYSTHGINHETTSNTT